MRALTKKDIALIRGGVESGYTSLEQELLNDIVESSLAEGNMAYDQEQINEEEQELAEDYWAEADDLAHGDLESVTLDEIGIDITLAQEAYYQTNYNENLEAWVYWSDKAQETQDEINARN